MSGEIDGRFRKIPWSLDSPVKIKASEYSRKSGEVASCH